MDPKMDTGFRSNEEGLLSRDFYSLLGMSQDFYAWCSQGHI